MPLGQIQDLGGWVASGISSGFGGFAQLADCPRIVEIRDYEGFIQLEQLIDALGKATGVESDPAAKQILAQQHGFGVDYLLLGNITATNTTNIGGNLYGHLTLDLALVDNCPDAGRSGNVLKEAQTSWDGGIVGQVGTAAMEALAQSFISLDDLIYDYERVPERCEIQPEKESVKIGETITINLQNIVDGKGRASQPWQHVLVKAEKGEILNGEENGEHRRFRVDGGSVAVKYKAPKECPEEKKDIITVENSCESCLTLTPNLPADREIARKEIKINCRVELEIMVHEVQTVSDPPLYMEHNEIARIPFFIEGNTIEMDEPAKSQYTASGHAGECTVSGGGEREFIIEGELVVSENNQAELHITLTHTVYAGSQVLVFSCPDGTHASHFPGATVIDTWEVTIPYQDGYVLEFPWAFPTVTGTTTYILHLNP